MYSGLPGCDTAPQGKWFPTFRRNVLPTSSGDLDPRRILEDGGDKFLRNCGKYRATQCLMPDVHNPPLF